MSLLNSVLKYPLLMNVNIVHDRSICLSLISRYRSMCLSLPELIGRVGFFGNHVIDFKPCGFMVIHFNPEF